ncbi:Uncharacterised protein [Mycobacteroides abscessus subsp. massiliense]|nr:Uncharacterised protein [Mycobacteroides abscessus subsp. massiliense]
MSEWPTHSAPKMGDLQAHSAAKSGAQGAAKAAPMVPFPIDGKSLFVNGPEPSQPAFRQLER